MDMNRKKLFWILHLIGPVLFLFVITRIVDFNKSIEVLKNANGLLILASLAFFPIIITIRTLRWRTICQNLDISYSFWESLELYYIGWFVGAFVPQGMGTFVKTIYLKKDGYPLGKSLLTIFLDKLFDLFGLLIFGSIGVIYFARFLPGKNLSLIYFVIISIPIVLFIFRQRIFQFFRTILKSYLVGKISRWTKVDFDTAKLVQNIPLKTILFLIGYSLSIATLRSVSMYILALALHLDVDFLFIVACRSLVGFALILPVSFMGLGTRDGVLMFCFSVVGKSVESAISLGIAAFLWAMLFRLLGVIFWLKYSVKKMKAKDNNEKDFCD
jgi:uncharacterized protein (TIRG00374 family)